ncbi:MAG: putative membrane protein YfcA [Crocinitomix sp.]|jgi:uncharacterized membrane protein YfcA
MISVLFIHFFGLIIVTAGALFSVLAHTRKNDMFFWFGLGCTLLVIFGIIANAEYYFLSNSSDSHIGIIIVATVVSIVFLALSRANKKPNDDNVTDAFLDDVINAEDEVWDPES